MVSLGLAAEALDSLIRDASGVLPAGFEVRDGALGFVLSRQEAYGGRDTRLEVRVKINAEVLMRAAALLEVRGADWPLRALEAGAAEWAMDYEHDLDDLHEQIEPEVKAALGAVATLGAADGAERVLSKLPEVIDYERRVEQLTTFHQATRALLHKALLVRLRAMVTEGRLPAPVEGLEERGNKLSLKLRRDLSVDFLGAPLALSVRSVRPLAGGEVETLCWSGDEAGVSEGLVRLLAPEDATLQRELHRALRYADVLFSQGVVVDRAAVARALEQVAARQGEFDDYRQVLSRLVNRAREEKFRADVEKIREHRSHYADVGGYYPLARSLGRSIELFLGPTNSGKTFRALNALTEGESGTYLAPLRLLALEGQYEIEARGKPCSYLTGEERDMREGARFASSTIEMLDFRTPVDAVLIDEIQLLSDPSRGWAWTAALVGAPARRVLLTGAPGCRAAVEQIARMLGEPLKVTETQRLAPLEVEKRPVSLSKIERGTAVIAFTRRDVLDLKATIEQSTQLKCSVIYGNLSPRVRREEARRFREGESDVIVSTDAIAMGLNLPVSRVVFFTSTKYDGQRERTLADQEILQIGGRAGRYGKAAKGTVTALTKEDLIHVQAAFNRGPRDIGPPFRVMPDERHVDLLSKILDTQSLERILVFFSQAITFDDDSFKPADLTDLCALAAIVDRKLPEADARTRLIFASAPVEVDNEVMRSAWERMMVAYVSRDERVIEDIFEVASYQKRRLTSDHMELLGAETQLKVLTVYSWLSYRFSAVYKKIEHCDAAKDVLASFIEESLRGRTIRRCSSCGVALPLGFRFGKCNACFRSAEGPEDLPPLVQIMRERARRSPPPKLPRGKGAKGGKKQRG